MHPTRYPGPERHRTDCDPAAGCVDIAGLRAHVDARMDDQDRRLDDLARTLAEIDAYFKASKIGGSLIRWFVTVGAAALAGWAALKGLK